MIYRSNLSSLVPLYRADSWQKGDYGSSVPDLSTRLAPRCDAIDFHAVSSSNTLLGRCLSRQPAAVSADRKLPVHRPVKWQKRGEAAKLRADTSGGERRRAARRGPVRENPGEWRRGSGRARTHLDGVSINSGPQFRLFTRWPRDGFRVTHRRRCKITGPMIPSRFRRPAWVWASAARGGRRVSCRILAWFSAGNNYYVNTASVVSREESNYRDRAIRARRVTPNKSRRKSEAFNDASIYSNGCARARAFPFSFFLLSLSYKSIMAKKKSFRSPNDAAEFSGRIIKRAMNHEWQELMESAEFVHDLKIRGYTKIFRLHWESAK